MKYVVRIPAGEFPPGDPIWKAWNGLVVVVAEKLDGNSARVRHPASGATTFLFPEWLVPLAPPIHSDLLTLKPFPPAPEDSSR